MILSKDEALKRVKKADISKAIKEFQDFEDEIAKPDANIEALKGIADSILKLVPGICDGMRVIPQSVESPHMERIAEELKCVKECIAKPVEWNFKIERNSDNQIINIVATQK